jgi:transmembrane sensor
MKRHKGQNMNKTTDWKLLARYLSNECTQEERNEVEAWIASHRNNQRLMELMEVTWDMPESQTQASDVKKLWKEVAEKAGISSEPEDREIAETRVPSPRTIKWPFDLQPVTYRTLRYAAVILLVAISVAYFFYKGGLPWIQHTTELKIVTIEKGDRKKVVLSDGTGIVLDAGSSLKYKEKFTGKNREVFFNGEGFFEVTKDAGRPFVVHANHAVVKVLGTKFNVRAWGSDKKVTVAVAEGRVSLRSEKEATQKEVIIAKDQLSVLLEGGVPSIPQSADIGEYVGWMNNEMNFENAPLREILYQLERWYDVQFVIEDSSITAEHLTLHIQNKTLDDILELISALTDIRYKRSDKLVYLKSGRIEQ